MPDANAHPADMFIIKGHALPRFWWLRPWTTARTLAVTVDALRSYADRADAALKASEMDALAAKQSRAHWIAIKSLTEDNKMLRKENQRLRDLLFVTKQTIAQHEMDYATKWLNKHFPKR